MSLPPINDTSGQAHPYWYEWFVGLFEVVKLLNPDEEIQSVAFQVSNIKVWDDVVVKTKSGRRCYQIKHTREGNNLTFGSLVETDTDGKSLLGALFNGWRQSELNDSSTELILYTNRQDGANWATLKIGSRRPPLLGFWQWLTDEIANLGSLSDLSVSKEYEDGWQEWINCLDTRNDADAIAFLRQLTIRTREDDLDGLENRIREGLATAFGVSEEKAAPLFDALIRALRQWTTGHPGVTVETLCTALTVPPEPKELAHAPPPPTPFCPTRIPVATDLERDLLSNDERPVVFLTGEPGSGKTSAVSWLANRRTDDAFHGSIGIRFFCFEPIRPEQPFIAPDSSRVKPEELWLSLLAQLRRGLEGRLHELAVPLRNSFLDWKEARKHVIRLADALGNQLGRRFVISIDGIDHAARASQVLPEQIEDFFASLPSPDELDGKSIRLLIAGQPPEYYTEQYPSWLQGEHSKVRRIDLPKLELADIRALLDDSDTQIPAAQFDEAVRLIDDLAQGNTLAIVFAVAESEATGSLGELKATLEQRCLSVGLSAYYDSIWNHALRNASKLSCSLACAVSLARKPVKPEQLARAFVDWEKPRAWWHEVLAELGPILVASDDGFQIRHNDVRVYLAAKFRAHSDRRKQSAVSHLASYFRTADCDRLSAHLQLFDSLALANREPEIPEVFDVDWVMEGSVLGIEFAQLRDEGEQATANLSNAANWSNVVSVACALQTLNRLSEDTDVYPELETQVTELPPFLPSEAGVRPFSQWSREDFHQLVWDAHELVEGAEKDRAVGLLNRWLGGLTLNQIVQSLPEIGTRMGVSKDDAPPRLDDMAQSDFENLGLLSGNLGWPMECNGEGKPSRLETNARFAFEKGFVNAVTDEPRADSLEHMFAIHRPVFMNNLELAVRNLANSQAWQLVAQLLAQVEREKLSKAFLAESTWFALRSGVYKTHPDWLAPLEESQYGLPTTTKHISHQGNRFEPYINTCRALGWTRIGFDTAEIADSVFQAFDPSGEFEDTAAMKLVFRAAAVLGRLEGLAEDGDWQKASESLSCQHISQLLSALWGDVIARASWRFEARKEAALVAQQLAEYCPRLGADFDAAVFDAALPFAQQHVLGPRQEAIWDAVSRHGRLDVLRDWIRHYVGPEGDVWKWAHYSARETVNELVPLAKSIGQDELADYASRRASWLLISYRERKEYSFEEISRWFLKAAENDPAIWSTAGWRLWQICTICDDTDGDNRFEPEIFDGISAAAVRCGAAAWWRLISTSLERASNRHWHYQTRERFVEGARIAIEQGAEIADDDILPMWSLLLCLSYWFDNGDNASLQRLRELLLLQASEGRQAELGSKMQSISSILRRREGGTESDEGEDDTAGPDVSNATVPRTDNAFWGEMDGLVSQLNSDHRRWGFYDKLFAIARERAFLHGNDVILEGLATQLQMHARWAFGGGELNQIAWKELPPEDTEVTWELVAVEFLKVLLNTHSAEAIGAALEGMHSLVDQNPEVIRNLFEVIDVEWSRRWLLNASESWAILYPNAVASIRAHLRCAIEQGDLDSRLQAWVVLCRNCDTLGDERILFPIPETPMLDVSDVEQIDTSLLDIPPTMLGHARIANRFSAARSILQYFETFGFNFSRLEGVIANGLIEFRDTNELPLDQRGPHRLDDFYCVPLDTERAVGHAISQILSSDWCSQHHIAELCEAFLPNEDSWIYRSRPRTITSADEWPLDGEYDAEEIDAATRQDRMLNAATSASLEDDWCVFVARAVDFTRKEDCVLNYWFEDLNESLLITAPHVPTCPGGRSFIWWIGEPFELDLDRFVSGLFVGGRQRLCHCHFEIRPPKSWRDVFGWEPNTNNPLEWQYEGRPVARYERVHGVLRENAQRPNYRQPLVDRWIVTRDAFQRVETMTGQLRSRHTFDIFRFRSE